MILRKSEERGLAKIDWLESRHTFSFGDFHDPNFMGFHNLRVINDDIIAPGKGFGAHPHRNMEIVTVILKGALKHQDSTGTESVIKAGQIQRMTAGAGIVHSEVNASDTEPVHLLQIWIEPNQRGLEPGYEERFVPKMGDGVIDIATPDGRDGSLKIHQDAVIKYGAIKEGEELSLAPNSGRSIWFHLISGQLNLSGDAVTQNLSSGDSFGIESGESIMMAAANEATFIMFELG